MSMEISQIENKTMRKAAERADSVGNLNGKLDDSEMSVFAQVAYSNGCDAKDIRAITGAETEDEKLAKVLNKMDEIEGKKKELEKTKNAIALKEESYDVVNKDSRKFNNIVKGVTGFLGGAAGFGALYGCGLIDKAINQKLSDKIDNAATESIKDTLISKRKAFYAIQDIVFGKTNAGGWIRVGLLVAAGVVGGIFAGKALIEKTNVFGLKPHSAKVSEKQAADYDKAEVEPLKVQAEKLEKEIKDMEYAFQVM